MIGRSSRWLALGMSASILAACTGATASPSPEPPSPSPEPPLGYLLRATIAQALPPESRFGWFPQVVITDLGELLEAAAVPAIFPGPLVPPFLARPLTPAGFTAIVEEARALGLLAGRTDFVPPEGVFPGEPLGRIELVADGRRFDLTGDPSRLVRCGEMRCVPDPGTPEAFAALWQRISSLDTWLERELGPVRPYNPPSYALLVTPPVNVDPGMRPNFMVWPLADALTVAGSPIGTGQLPRCISVRGADADAVRPALGAANQLTRWVDAEGRPDGGLSLQVRPMLVGEDVCLEVFGVGS